MTYNDIVASMAMAGHKQKSYSEYRAAIKAINSLMNAADYIEKQGKHEAAAILRNHAILMSVTIYEPKLPNKIVNAL